MPYIPGGSGLPLRSSCCQRLENQIRSLPSPSNRLKPLYACAPFLICSTYSTADMLPVRKSLTSAPLLGASGRFSDGARIFVMAANLLAGDPGPPVAGDAHPRTASLQVTACINMRSVLPPACGCGGAFVKFIAVARRRSMTSTGSASMRKRSGTWRDIQKIFAMARASVGNQGR